MEFWGAEVKSGQSLVVKMGSELLHLSQACLDDVKKAKGSESISLFVKSGNQKLVLGYLSAEKTPRVAFDLMFDKEFELSHNWKNGSVHFTGYKSLQGFVFTPEDSDAEEDEPLAVADNGGRIVNIEEVKKAIKSDKDEAISDDDDESSDDEEFDADQAMVKNEDDSTDEDESTDDDDDDDDSEDETDDSDEETPKNADVSKKRPAESVKTPANEKKAKFVTPEKTGSKKGNVHTATPHPAKQAGKIPSTSDSSKQQNAKSGGAFRCPPCNRSFNSDGALQSHTKAKHSAAK